MAKTEDDANPRSLSAAHGTRPFPLHTDGASLRNPPSLVAMWAPRDYEAATLLVDGASECLAHPLFARSWVVVPGGGRPRFYAIPRVGRGRDVRWRLNLDCMLAPQEVKELNDTGTPLIRAQPIRVEWRAGDAIVLDNRRVLHGRERVSACDGERRLVRIAIRT